MLHTKIAEFTGLRSLLWDSDCLQPAVKFAYPAFDEHGDERSEEHDSETSVEKSIDDNNVLWRGEVRRDIWSKARIAHHLGLVYQYVLDGIQRVRFEAAEEFNEERAQETGEQRSLCTRSIRSKVKGRKTYEDEDSIHLFEPLFLTFTVDNLHSYPCSRIRDGTMMWLHTCLHCSIPRLS